MGSAEPPRDLESLHGCVQKWTLAQDTSLFEHLEEFSKAVVTRTEKTSKLLQATSENAQKSHIRLQSCVNSFNMLSNMQFMESRVRDEDTAAALKARETAEASKTQLAASEPVENTRLQELREAIVLTKDVLGTLFDVVEVNVDDSDDEDSATPTTRRTFREPKDPYLRRPLPYLIGSQDFHRDRHIGLKLQTDDQQSNPDEDVILTAKLDDLLVPTISAATSDRLRSETQLSSGQNTPRIPDIPAEQSPPFAAVSKPPVFPGRKATTLVSSDSEEDENDIFASRPIITQKTVNSALPVNPILEALRTSPPPSRTRSSSQNSSHSSSVAKQTSIFDDDEENDLFSTNKPKAAAGNAIPGIAKVDTRPDQLKITKKPVVAARSVAVSKEASIFDDDEGQDGLFATTKTVATSKLSASFVNELSKKIGIQPVEKMVDDMLQPVETAPTSKSTVPVVGPSKVVQPAKKSTLFDDDDEDDLFAVAPKVPPRAVAVGKATKPKNTDVSSSSQLPKTSVPLTNTVKPPSKKTPVSLFDDDDSDENTTVNDLKFRSVTKPAASFPNPRNTVDTPQEAVPYVAPRGASEVISKDLETSQNASNTLLLENDEAKPLSNSGPVKWKLPGLSQAVVEQAAENPVVQKQPTSSSQQKELQKPATTASVKKAPAFSFEDSDDDGEDLFSVSNTPKVVEAKPRKTMDSESGAIVRNKSDEENTNAPVVLDKVPKSEASTGNHGSSKKEVLPLDDEEDVDLFASKMIPKQQQNLMANQLDGLERTTDAKDPPLANHISNNLPPEINHPNSLSAFPGKKEREESSSDIVLPASDVDQVEGPDLPLPQLLPLPKTAPAALHGPLKWQLPGLPKSADSDSSSLSIQEKPTAKPPAPSPRRRGAPKSVVEVDTDPSPAIGDSQHVLDMPSRSRGTSHTSPFGASEKQPTIAEEDEEEDLFSAGKTLLVQRIHENKIPMILEMVLDTEVKRAKPTPPVPARRTTAAKLVQPSESKTVVGPELAVADVVVKEPSVEPILSTGFSQSFNQNMSENPVTVPVAHVQPSVSAPVFVIPALSSVEPSSLLFEPPPLTSTPSSLSSSQASLKKRAGSMFDDDDDSDEDLFSTKPKLGSFTAKVHEKPKLPVTSLVPNASLSNGHNPLVTAEVSKFGYFSVGAALDPLNSTYTSPTVGPAAPVAEEPKTAQPAVKPAVFNIEQPPSKSSSVFDLSDDEDLFTEPASIHAKVASPAAAVTSLPVVSVPARKITKVSLFEDDDDDDLFKN